MQSVKDRIGTDGIQFCAAMARIWMWVVEIGERRIGNTGTHRLRYNRTGTSYHSRFVNRRYVCWLEYFENISPPSASAANSRRAIN